MSGEGQLAWSTSTWGRREGRDCNGHEEDSRRRVVVSAVASLLNPELAGLIPELLPASGVQLQPNEDLALKEGK